MKIGLFFGSFNPIHIGHLIMADHFAQHANLDQLWLVVSPRNPLKEKSSLLADHHRLAMVRIAVEDNPRLQASNVEFDLPQPSYTSHTLAYLKEKYEQHEFALIMGEDNLRNFHKWKNHEHIIEQHQIYVYPRMKTEGENSFTSERTKKWLLHNNVHVVNAPVVQISATSIRTAIKEGLDVRYLLSEPVYQYCKEMHFYEK